jgi:hypothetical protein
MEYQKELKTIAIVLILKEMPYVINLWFIILLFLVLQALPLTKNYSRRFTFWGLCCACGNPQKVKWSAIICYAHLQRSRRL